MKDKPFPVLLLEAELSTGNATIRSLGVAYALLIAYANAQYDRPEWTPEARTAFWSGANTPIGEHLQAAEDGAPEGSDALAMKRALKIERVKRVGWQVHDAAARLSIAPHVQDTIDAVSNPQPAA